jgi:LPXTG-site transpeptidase (sortase) family protein
MAFGIILFLFLVPSVPYFVAHIRYRLKLLQSSSISIQNPTLTPATTTVPLLPPDTMFIPGVDIRAPLIYIERKDEGSIQKALQKGVVHYAGTAKPGEYGNAYFVGHSSDLPWAQGDYKTVFALLPELKAEDRFYLSNASGTTFVYKVLTTRVVNPTDMSVLDQQGKKERLLTLQTSYPLGTALKRFLVIALYESQAEAEKNSENKK